MKRLFMVALVTILIASTLPISGQEEILLRIGCQELETLNIWNTGWSPPVIHWFYPSFYYRKPVTFEPLSDICTVSFDELTNSSPDGLTFVFPLRDDIQWDDRTPLTAHDFVFAYELVMTLELIMTFDYMLAYEDVEYMKAVGPYTVELKLKKCTPRFEESILYHFAVPAHQFRSLLIEALGTDSPRETFMNMNVDNPISAGPFSFKYWEKGSYLKLVTNPTYHGKGRMVDIPGVGEIEEGPYYDGLFLKLYPDLLYTTDEALQDIKKGNIDLIWWNLDSGDIAQLSGDPQITIETAHGLGFYYLAPNLAKEPFDDLTLRKALIYMVDKEFIVNSVLREYGGVAHSVVMPAAGEWYNDTVNKFGSGMSTEERLARAKEILTVAGYSVPVGMYPQDVLILPTGEEMQPFEILIPSADYDLMRFTAGHLIQEWWRELGVPATARQASFDEVVRETFGRKTFDWYVLGWRFGGSGYPSYLRRFFHSDRILQGNNPMSYKNPEVDKLLEDLVSTCDHDKLVEAAWKIQEIIIEEAGYCPLYYRTIEEAHRNDTFTGWFTQLGGIAYDKSTRSCLLYLKPIAKKPKDTSAPSETAQPPKEGFCFGTILLADMLTVGVAVVYRRRR
ncbi:MAG: hypothetical protein AYK19_14125 [Theionarchaea archaeon DG-70-1]|nr:MAG: hypothetical protein AYK19_14125 [Theionarchaea archaeon DG-70-1]